MKMFKCDECGCDLKTPSEQNVGYCEECHQRLDDEEDTEYEE